MMAWKSRNARPTRGALSPWIEDLIGSYQVGAGEGLEVGRCLKAQVQALGQPSASQAQVWDGPAGLLFLSDGVVRMPAVLTAAAWERLQECEDRESLASLLHVTVCVRRARLLFHMAPEQTHCRFFLSVGEMVTAAAGPAGESAPCCTALPAVRNAICRTWRALRGRDESQNSQDVELSELLGEWQRDCLQEVLNDVRRRLTEGMDSPQPSTSTGHAPSTGWDRDRLRYKGEESFSVPVQWLLIPTSSVEDPPAEGTTSEPPPAEPTTSEPPPAEGTTSEPPPAEPTTSEPPPAEPTTSEPPPAEGTTSEPPPAEPTTSEPPPAEGTPSGPPPAEPTTSEPPPAEPTTSGPPPRPPPAEGTPSGPPTDPSCDPPDSPVEVGTPPEHFITDASLIDGCRWSSPWDAFPPPSIASESSLDPSPEAVPAQTTRSDRDSLAATQSAASEDSPVLTLDGIPAKAARSDRDSLTALGSTPSTGPLVLSLHTVSDTTTGSDNALLAAVQTTGSKSSLDLDAVPVKTTRSDPAPLAATQSTGSESSPDPCPDAVPTVPAGSSWALQATVPTTGSRPSRDTVPAQTTGSDRDLLAATQSTGSEPSPDPSPDAVPSVTAGSKRDPLAATHTGGSKGSGSLPPYQKEPSWSSSSSSRKRRRSQGSPQAVDPPQEEEEVHGSPPSWLFDSQAGGSSPESDLSPQQPGGRKIPSMHFNGSPFSYSYRPTGQNLQDLSRLCISGSVLQWAVKYLVAPELAPGNCSQKHSDMRDEQKRWRHKTSGKES